MWDILRESAEELMEKRKTPPVFHSGGG